MIYKSLITHIISEKKKKKNNLLKVNVCKQKGNITCLQSSVY